MDPIKTTCVNFRVRVKTPAGFVACLVGSEEVLGSWAPLKAKVMKHNKSLNCWTVEVKLQRIKICRYRFFVARPLWDKDGSAIFKSQPDPTDLEHASGLSILCWESNIESRCLDTRDLPIFYELPMVEFSVRDDLYSEWSRGWQVNLTGVRINLSGPHPIQIWDLEKEDIRLYGVKCIPVNYKLMCKEHRRFTLLEDEDGTASRLARFLKVSSLPVSTFMTSQGRQGRFEFSSHSTPSYATDVLVCKLDGAHNTPKLQPDYGLPFRNGEYLSFEMDTSNPDALGFRFEYYLEIDGLVKCMGYSHVLPLARNYSSKIIPIFGMNSAPIGELSLDYLLISPTPDLNLDMEISFQNHWKWERRGIAIEVGHRGFGSTYADRKISSVKENTIASLNVAATHGVHYAEFDVQLSKDMIPVVYHDFNVQVMHQKRHDASDLYQIGVKDLTLSQLQSTKLFYYSDDVTAAIELYEENKMDSCDLDPFPTLEKCLATVDLALGFNIEVKYPQKLESGQMEIDNYFDRNTMVDLIINTVYKNYNGRRILFSSFDADTCIMLQRKQNIFPVLFLTQGLSPMYVPFHDHRTRSFEAALNFAVSERLLGVDLLTEELVKDLTVVRKAQKMGLVVFVWGHDNNDPVVTELLRKHRVDGIITDVINFSSYREGGAEVFMLTRKTSSMHLETSKLVIESRRNSFSPKLYKPLASETQGSKSFSRSSSPPVHSILMDGKRQEVA